MKKYLILALLLSISGFSQEIALLKYSGGGDWYANPTSLPNLIKYANQNINTKIKSKPATVEPSSPDLFSYPFVHMTGHGNVVFSDSDVINLRNYMLSGGFLHIDDVHMTGHGNVVFSDSDVINLRNYMLSGGFLHIDDNYGMNEFIRKEISKIFPNTNLVELPASHAIFQSPNVFAGGLPKIHEHDGKRPQAFGIFENNRLVLLYTYECDLGDGWEDAEVNNDPKEVREKALKMGVNILNYIFKN